VTGGITRPVIPSIPVSFTQLTKLNRLEVELSEGQYQLSSSAGVQNAPLGYEYHSATVSVIRQFFTAIAFRWGTVLPTSSRTTM